jgi:hypothetical protein
MPPTSSLGTATAMAAALALLGIIAGGAALMSSRTSGHAQEASERRHASQLIAEELQRNSSDLARLRQACVNVGDPRSRGLLPEEAVPGAGNSSLPKQRPRTPDPLFKDPLDRSARARQVVSIAGTGTLTARYAELASVGPTRTGSPSLGVPGWVRERVSASGAGLPLWHRATGIDRSIEELLIRIDEGARMDFEEAMRASERWSRLAVGTLVLMISGLLGCLLWTRRTASSESMASDPALAAGTNAGEAATSSRSAVRTRDQAGHAIEDIVVSVKRVNAIVNQITSLPDQTATEKDRRTARPPSPATLAKDSLRNIERP